MQMNPRSLRHGIILALTAAAGLLFAGCDPTEKDRLSAVKRSGEIVVLTRNSPTTYYEGPDGPTGFEYDLARAFADRLGVSLMMKSVTPFGDILPMVARGEASFAAAGLTITPGREALVRFTPHYQTIRQQVVYNGGSAPPANSAGLVGRQIEVVAGTSYIERLEELRKKMPKLRWVAHTNLETEELLVQIQEGLTDLTIADSNIVALSTQFNTDLRVAFDLSDAEKLGWAFPIEEDDSLYQEATRFIADMRASGKLDQLIEHYYGAATRLNPINIAVFQQKIESDLPRFRPVFEEAGRRYLLDWRLLAAMSYQESYWNPDAVSQTGVRGIMMLTEITAEHLGVGNRLDPTQSIHGGAAYLRSLRDNIPAAISEPDRTWMALAAYNVGFGHLEDARIITQIQKADPNKWNDVKERLPLLTKAAWHTKTRHGYARGYEPVQFVTRIRTYYEVLKKFDDEDRARRSTDVLRLRAPAL